jgi:hypothetical protein
VCYSFYVPFLCLDFFILSHFIIATATAAAGNIIHSRDARITHQGHKLLLHEFFLTLCFSFFVSPRPSGRQRTDEMHPLCFITPQPLIDASKKHPNAHFSLNLRSGKHKHWAF